MKKRLKKKQAIRIPNFIFLFYSSKKNIIILSGMYVKKCLKLETQLFLIQSKRILKISSLPFFNISKNKKKKNKTHQGTTISLIKNFIIEASSILYQKLKIIGVGFRVSGLNNSKNNLLLFKLGYSHFIYFKLTTAITICCLKMTRLYIFGNCYQNLTRIIASIKSYKKPDFYKGKGIFNDTEKIILKEGKKV